MFTLYMFHKHHIIRMFIFLVYESVWVLATFAFRLWRYMQYVPAKRW
jgi:hypothetical protein